MASPEQLMAALACLGPAERGLAETGLATDIPNSGGRDVRRLELAHALAAAAEIQILLGAVDHLTAQVAELDRWIDQALQETAGTTRPPEVPLPRHDLVDRLDAIPGVGPATAQILLAEVGADMSRFPTPSHLVSWAKLCPRTVQSGTKHSTRLAGPGTPGYAAPSEKPPRPPPAPRPSSVPATAASSNAAATPKHSSRSPAPSS